AGGGPRAGCRGPAGPPRAARRRAARLPGPDLGGRRPLGRAGAGPRRRGGLLPPRLCPGAGAPPGRPPPRPPRPGHPAAGGDGGVVAAREWAAWRGGGMAADLAGLPADLRQAREAVLATGIAPAEGREVFSRILRRGATPQILVSTKDLGAVLAMLERRARGE